MALAGEILRDQHIPGAEAAHRAERQGIRFSLRHIAATGCDFSSRSPTIPATYFCLATTWSLILS